MAPRLGGALGEAAVLGTMLLVCLFLAAAGRRRQSGDRAGRMVRGLRGLR